MKKKLGILCLVAVMLISLVACGGSGNTELDKAKQAVEGFVNAFAKFDAAGMKKFLTEADSEDMADDEFTEEAVAEEGTDFLVDVIKSIKPQYKSGEVKAGDSTAQLNYTINRIDMSALMAEYIKQISDAELGTEADVKINAKDFGTKDYELTVSLVKENNAWKVSDVEELVMKLYGMDEMMEAISQMFED